LYEQKKAKKEAELEALKIWNRIELLR